MEDVTESQGLLENISNQSYGGNDEIPVAAHAATNIGAVATVSPIGPDELPPSFCQSTDGEATPMVTCRVCQAMVDITGKHDQHVVKCSNCNEATPIRNAPAGKKYVRCPCHCLLICKSSSQRIACPRPNCKRIINLAPSPVTPPMPSIIGMHRILCGHCHDTFVFNTMLNGFARCPHCHKVSSMGPEFARRKGQRFLMGGGLCLLLGTILSSTTYHYASQHPIMISIYVAIFLLAIYLFVRAIYNYVWQRVSTIEGPM